MNSQNRGRTVKTSTVCVVRRATRDEWCDDDDVFMVVDTGKGVKLLLGYDAVDELTAAMNDVPGIDGADLCVNIKTMCEVVPSGVMDVPFDAAEEVWKMFSGGRRNDSAIKLIQAKLNMDGTRIQAVLRQYVLEEEYMIRAVGGEDAFRAMNLQVRPRCYYATDGFGREHVERDVDAGTGGPIAS